jgi:hypothetical protein
MLGVVPAASGATNVVAQTKRQFEQTLPFPEGDGEQR